MTFERDRAYTGMTLADRDRSVVGYFLAGIFFIEIGEENGY